MIAALLGLWMGATADPTPRAPSSPPLRIDDAETVEAGHAELNLSVGGVYGRSGWEAEAPLVDANLGVSPHVHINAELPLVQTGPPAHAGLGQAAVAVKWQALRGARGALAVHPALALPAFPKGAADPGAQAALTIPVVGDLALGAAGTGLGLELARTFAADPAEGGWEAMAGLATPVAEAADLMVDYAQEAGPTGAPGEGWLEVGFVQDHLFGRDPVALFAAGALSTEAQRALTIGVQIGI